MEIAITKKDAEYRFAANPGEKILYAGLRNGVKLPHECATGTCGSCKASLKSGEIKSLWPQAPGAKSIKPAKNEFLMCQSVAQTDCQISYRAALEVEPDMAYRPDYVNGKITHSELLTRDVKRVIVSLDQPMPFQPGQFVVVEAGGLTGGRAYSMVNCDKNSDEMEFVIKQLPSGGFSKWLFQETRVDATVSIYGPLGKAVLGADEQKNLVCITGGSGIAGIISLLTEAANCGYFEKNSGHLFFGVRSYQDLFFHNRLLDLNQLTKAKLQVTFTFSQGAVPNGRDEWPLNINYLSGDVVPLAMEEISESVENTIAFLAGPPGMVESGIKQLVLEKNFPVNNIRYDKFG